MQRCLEVLKELMSNQGRTCMSGDSLFSFPWSWVLSLHEFLLSLVSSFFGNIHDVLQDKVFYFLDVTVQREEAMQGSCLLLADDPSFLLRILTCMSRVNKSIVYFSLHLESPSFRTHTRIEVSWVKGQTRRSWIWRQQSIHDLTSVTNGSRSFSCYSTFYEQFRDVCFSVSCPAASDLVLKCRWFFFFHWSFMSIHVCCNMFVYWNGNSFQHHFEGRSNEYLREGLSHLWISDSD